MTADRAALVERVARLMCEQRGQHPDSVCYRLKIDGGHETIRRWMNYTKNATAAIDLIRAETLEEAARVADGENGHYEETGSVPTDFMNAGRNDAAVTIAAAIRALKD
jgi:hypothetical protein